MGEPLRSCIRGAEIIARVGDDLILTAVTLADGAGVIVVHHEVLGKLLLDLSLIHI